MIISITSINTIFDRTNEIIAMRITCQKKLNEWMNELPCCLLNFNFQKKIFFLLSWNTYKGCHFWLKKIKKIRCHSFIFYIKFFSFDLILFDLICPNMNKIKALHLFFILIFSHHQWWITNFDYNNVNLFFENLTIWNRHLLVKKIKL